MLLAGEEYEKNSRLSEILRPYLRLVDNKIQHVIDEDAPDEVKQAYEEYLEFNKKYEGFG